MRCNVYAMFYGETRLSICMGIIRNVGMPVPPSVSVPEEMHRIFKDQSFDIEASMELREESCECSILVKLPTDALEVRRGTCLLFAAVSRLAYSES